LYELRRSGQFVEVNEILRRPEFRNQQRPDAETRKLFRDALRQAWAQADAGASAEGPNRFPHPPTEP
ncbi:hypothetical protein, partial [Streptomyces roseolus]|uniref:hypothetical protein n=1 Tax=Streptomyces roseolus TaxID=67358 RepID=UPI003653095C